MTPFRLVIAGGGTGGHLFPGIAIAQVLNRLYAPDFNLDAFNRLLQDPRVIEGILSGQQPDQLVAGWDEEVAGFAKRREAYLLYR